jgi:hypothetical protein
MPLLLRDRAEQRVGQLACDRVEAQAEILSVERPQGVVQEVESVRPELEFFRLRDGKALKERQVGVEVCRSVQHRKNGRAVQAGRRRKREAARVDVLVMAQSVPRVASDDGTEIDVGSAQNRNVADGIAGSVLVPVGVDPEVLAAVAGEVGAALNLSHA